MFVKNQRFPLPEDIVSVGHNVGVKDSIKLVGAIFDSKLSFSII